MPLQTPGQDKALFKFRAGTTGLNLPEQEESLLMVCLVLGG